MLARPQRGEEWPEVEAAERRYLFGEGAVEGDGPSRSGLAISGGGIRSASFGLGILQALVAGGLLPKVDYLSTVSGGGYIGSSLTWFLKRGLPNGKPAGTKPEDFPFGRARVGGRAEGGSRNAILDFIRQHGNYLLPGSGLNVASLVGVVLRTIGVALLVYGAILVALMEAGLAAGIFAPLPGDPAVLASFPNPLLLVAAGLMVALLAFGVAYGLVSGLEIGGANLRYRLRVDVQIVLGAMLGGAAVLTILGVIPIVHREVGEALAGGLASVSTVVGGVLGFFQARSEHRGTADGVLSSLRIYAGAALLLFGLLVGSYAIAQGLPTLPALAMGVVALLAGGFMNLNYLSPHRMYRDRLMETFQPDFENVKSGKWGRATEADGATIESMCEGDNRRPYHLINTNVVLVDSKEAKYNGRGGDSFLVSRLYCGSNATGWTPSDGYMKRPGRGMTLPTAMAISGAAANPHTGVAGGGPTRTRLISALMALLNLRLGYWAPHPGCKRGLRWPPNFVHPGVLAIFGQGLNERGRMVELTDGGHFENLGIYELIRRRVDVVLVSDGGADKEFAFGDLANAVERVRVDFGVKISFPDRDFDLRSLLPGSASPLQAPTGEKFPLAKRGFAVGTIEYPAAGEGRPKKTGKLLYLKTTLVAGLPPDLYGYKQAHTDFPDESTADQFFDERQFEAYRELGYHIGWQLLEEEEERRGELLTAIGPTREAKP